MFGFFFKRKLLIDLQDKLESNSMASNSHGRSEKISRLIWN